MTATPLSLAPQDMSDIEFSVILDIRPHAASTPTLPDAIAVRTDELLAEPGRFIEASTDPVLVVCDIGMRSELVATQLKIAGYHQVVSLGGGIAAWVEAGLPTRAPGGLSGDDFTRYDRQLKLPDFGIRAQQAMRDARVAIVGVGGLGVPVLSYLAGAGVGHLTIIDSDHIEVSNLHRQPIYSMSNVGRSKAEAAAAYAVGLNPTIEVDHRSLRIDDDNVLEALSGHDLIVTCTDSFETAHAINRAAVALGVPMVFGSVYRTEGQFSVFDADRGPCYGCVFPPHRGATGLDCSIVGVLGPVTGVVGSLQAVEAVKVITGFEEAIIGKLKLYDASNETIETLSVRKDPDCRTCGPGQEAP